ncbi:tRNA pseudouridine(13) synthase TruD [Methanobacterium spitsbergense]|uniref:Probable tRNA pseudouridine synthase D n=1 Tax=Methanobacterium spitsbergense TaxID=2874285 RepID=A0A8T5UZZ1_9EURY|nr:tRNA pseudouridine(13) synthase TruD [Methanobacterium spitsbergense]MBZ2165151.1 tRNA pseudouridine(13) synthase TruD [Methanobacterium spitsbergense]
MLNAETYITKDKGIGGKIRTKYEDFYVEEIPEHLPSGTGPNTWILIEKIGRNTLEVVLDIAKEFKISRKRMGFAGMKDKSALTRQWLCVSNSEASELVGLEDKLYNVKVLEIKQNEKKLRIGQLIGNKFRILIRDTENPENDVKTANNILSKLETVGVPNYYGWQRFGKNRPNTHRVGEYIVQNDIKGAVDSYIGNPYPKEKDHIKSARQYYDDGELEEAYESMPAGMRYEKMMLRELMKQKRKKGELNENSYKIALESLPKPLKRMFVHAYQSYLFNKVVSERSKLGIDKYVDGDIIIDNEEHLVHEFDINNINERIKSFEVHPTAPLYGTKVPLAEGVVGKIEQKVLDDEGIKLEDFECPKTPKLGSHGLRRAIRFKIWDISAVETSEGVLTEFSIPKGCYATAVLREIMKEDVY